MNKKLILIGLLMFALWIHTGPGGARNVEAQVDSTKLFLCGSGFAVAPTDVGSGSKINGGFQIEGDYPILTKFTKKFTVGMTYKDWYIKKLHDGNGNEGQGTTYLGGTGTIWARDCGSSYNLGFMGEYGQSTIEVGEEKNSKNGLVWGIIFKATIPKLEPIMVVANIKIGKFGDSKDDALMVGLGVGSPISLPISF